MKRTAVFVFVAFCAVSALSSMVDENKSKPSATVSPASEFGATSAKPTTTTTTNTTTTKPTTTTTTNTTTTKPTTTTKHTTTTNTTTTKPTTTTTTNTTTTKPTTTTTTNTTTTKPTTTTTTNTTTTKPTTTKPTTTTTTTTTTPATTTTKPTPTQPTNLTVGNYSLKKDNMICLMAQMALQIRLATPQLNGTFIVQPHLTSTQGGCQETTVNFTIAFKEGFITFMFNKSTADNTVYVDALSFKLSYPFSKGGNGVYSANNQSVNLFAATIGHSYSCKAESLYMGNGLYLDVNQDRMQAFNLKNNIDFGTPDPCAADRPDYRVAIAVGVTLLVLIVIVVIAYLLGRKRRTDGYQSL